VKDRIERFIADKSLVMVGASSKKKKFGNYAAKELRARGYQPVLVHPSAAEIDGMPCVKSVTEAASRSKSLWLCVPAAHGMDVVREAAKAGFTRVWLQQGAESAELVSLCEELKLEVIWKRCILMYATPIRGGHAVHRFIIKVVGKLDAMPPRPNPLAPPAHKHPH
jgi:hypothetical protein